MNTVPLLVGPTAIGKTLLSEKISELMDIEVVSADSRQIYRLLNIGTAKPKPELLTKLPHHFINFLRPDEYFSAGMYSSIGRRIIDQIFTRGRIPLVVGGSGLYIRALVDGLHTIEIRDEKIRSILRLRILREGIGKLYEELRQHDPQWAEKIQPTDKQRIIRGLEVYIKSGKKISDLQESQTPASSFKALFYGLKADRAWLYDRIDRRVDKMLEEGFLSEAANLKLRGYTMQLNSLNTVGYKEVFEYLENRISYDAMIDQIKKNTRRYAKRQMTWFRRDDRVQWYSVDEDTDFNELARKIVQSYQNHQ